MIDRDVNHSGRGDRRGEHATFRELKAAEEALVRRMGAIEMEQASQRAALMHLPEDVRQLTQAVNAMASKMPASPAPSAIPDQTLLAIQRTLDVISKQQTTPASDLIKLLQTPPPGSGGKTWALVGALSVVAAILGWRLFIG